MKQNDRIFVVAQAFYGNRTGTEIRPENMDAFIWGYVDPKFATHIKPDRAMIRVPDTDHLVIVYDRNQEKRRREECARLKKEGHICKPLAFIPEENIELYSRCIVCRINSDGTFASLEKGDGEKFVKYLAE